MSWKAETRSALYCVVTLAIGLWLAGVLAGCQPIAPPADPAAAARGKLLYHSLACDSCHGLDAVGSTRTNGPTHNHLRATAGQRIRAADYTGKAATAVEYIRESIVDPKVYLVPGYEHVRFGMASFAYLNEEDVSALVQFLYQQE